ncbi:helicase associated domain-containing protein, partial [Streptomyces chumphonensis]|uniref:helicase associated domain-containing protein n=1 Tax=Streptomyces chumphonensis TaxID=1214925 RepID=UPI003640E0CD
EGVGLAGAEGVLGLPLVGAACCGCVRPVRKRCGWSWTRTWRSYSRPRQHEEVPLPAAPDGRTVAGGAPVTVRLGVWLTNQKARRAKLSEERRTTLAGLGLHWTR